MWKQIFFEADDEDKRKLKSLRGVHCHQRDGHITAILVSVGGERGSIYEITKSATFLMVVVYSGINEFLKVLYPTLGLIRIFSSKHFCLTCVANGGLDDLGGRLLLRARDQALDD